MPLAPAIAASLSAGLPTRARSLWVNSVDVMLRPGATGNGYGIPIDTVRLVEGGPGTVSSLSFTIEDPLLEISLAEGQLIRLHNHTRGIPEFLGFVQSWTVRPDSAGRQIDVIAQGVEAILDWLMVPPMTFPAGMVTEAAVQLAYASSVGFAGLALRAMAAPPFNPSTQAIPICAGGASGALQYAVVTQSTISLRQVIAAILVADVPSDPVWAGYFLELTIDFYAGLRVWLSFQNAGGPADYTTIGPGGQHADLRYTADAGGAIHSVWVSGGNAAGTGLVTDGSGIPGKTAVVSDPTSLTSAQRAAVGQAFLQDKSLAFRGSVRLEEPAFEAILSPGVTEIHAGGQIQLDDAQAGLTAFLLRITGIEKRIHPSGKADWTIRYGGNPPRATDHIRRLTKDRFR